MISRDPFKPLQFCDSVISSSPSYLAEKINSHLATTSFQVVESNKVSTEPPLLQNNHSSLSHSSFQTLHALHCLSLDALQLLLVVWGTTVHCTQGAALPVQSTRGCPSPLVFPSPSGYANSHRRWDTTGLLGHPGTLLAHA